MNAFSMILSDWILLDINKNNCSRFKPKYCWGVIFTAVYCIRAFPGTVMTYVINHNN